MANRVAWLALLLSGPAAGAPHRVVSLNLCTDELVLLLAAPGQIASVTHLAQDRRETPLWRRAAGIPANDGTLLSVAGRRPDLIVTMGGAGADRARLAGAIGARFLALPYPGSVDGVMASVSAVAGALGRTAAGERVAAAIRRARDDAPPALRPATFLMGGGRTAAPTGLAAQWLALAGFRQTAVPGDRVTVETLLRAPPRWLIASNYRADQSSREADWLAQPALRALSSRRLTTDGRRWTCAGPSLLPEILRLRAIAR